jgi:hypothetical protein
VGGVGNGATSGPGGTGGAATQTATSAPAKNTGSVTGSSSANSGDQISQVNQTAPCADHGIAFSGTNSGVNTVGNNNRTNNNSGQVNGVVIQGIGGSSLDIGLGLTRDGILGGRGSSQSSVVQNAVNNLGNTNAQAAQAQGGKKGSSPNQNSTQNFITP